MGFTISDVRGLSPSVWLPLALVTLVTTYLLLTAIYNIYFHPLRIYPGPKFRAAFLFPYILAFLTGQSALSAARMHAMYGEIVRVAPNRLSYTDPQAYRDIRGHRKGGQGENGKDPMFYFLNTKNVLGAARDYHAQVRRVLSHGFSAKSMQDQAPLITRYVDLLIDRLHHHKPSHDGRKVVDLSAWFNFATFDIIGDLAFGAPFDCVENGAYHPWVETIVEFVKAIGYVVTVDTYAPAILPYIKYIIPSATGQEELIAFARNRIAKRLELNTERPDFIDTMTNAKSEETTLSRTEVEDNAQFLIFAGSETTASALSGAVYFLAKHPEVQAKLAAEVRNEFKEESEIDIFGVPKLTYMLAVLDESMRMFPPVPSALPRVCQPGGDVIVGKPVPAGTGLDLYQWAIHYSESNFTKPTEFHPERWLGDPRFDTDRKDAFQPFSIGPRNCIGKNLAYMEMRLILARLVWNFDISFADDESKKWIDICEMFGVWRRYPLNMVLTPARA
ncbi:cytochrome P450 monooxygenase [Diplogelasinospora grovesii]|uniref:Cytochrome P450 monooxygenase n=1 Tax=Diplogelasinospora grovesii TaxID=303347 RepID=A0AAN6N511_9PEZI|nr:cytochrome P450 monooxygenase [Diplogelasinospora grovesii]